MTRDRFFHDSFGGEASPESIADHVILVTDPLLVDVLSASLDGAVKVADHYEFQVVTGMSGDTKVTVCSTGLGGGSTSIAVDNLVDLGARSLLIVDAGLADDAMATTQYWCGVGAVRHDGASLDYARPEFPAAASPDAQLSLFAAAAHLGIQLAQAVFWASVLPLAGEDLEVVRHYNRTLQASSAPFGVPIVKASPEIATVLTLGTLYGCRVGALFASTPASDFRNEAMKILFDVALKGCEFSAEWEDSFGDLGGRLVIPNRLGR